MLLRNSREGRVRLISTAGLFIGVFVLCFISRAVYAEESHQHEAHEHGTARMNVAVEGNNVDIEFFSPAANIVGFEHHPRTHDQKEAVEDAVKKLQAGDALFAFSAESQCRLVKYHVDTDIDEDADHHSESEHAHDEEKHHDQEEHHDKDHHDADEHERHSEFEAEYRFVCSKPERLSQIDVALFGVFPGIEHIEVQFISETKQTAMELTAKENRMSW